MHTHVHFHAFNGLEQMATDRKAEVDSPLLSVPTLHRVRRASLVPRFVHSHKDTREMRYSQTSSRNKSSGKASQRLPKRVHKFKRNHQRRPLHLEGSIKTAATSTTLHPCQPDGPESRSSFFEVLQALEALPRRNRRWRWSW